MQSKMPDICAAANCNQCTDQSNIAFFRFPRDPVRCKQWLDKCRRPDLEQKTPEQLHKLYKLCARHFEPSLICKNSTLRTVLQQDAVPTIFDFTSHLNNPNSRNRKRIREINEEESSDSKKAKDGEPCPALEPKDVLGESSAACGLDRDACEEEDPSISKTKETLKLYFKETLAFTGFSIRASAAAGEPPESRAGLARPSCACAGKIDPREVLQVGEDCMRDEIRGSLRSARFFSVLLEDVASIEGRDQIPVFVRSVTVAGFPQKHLMGFLPCDGEAETLAYMLLSAVRNKWGLRMEHCRGLTYLTSGRISQKMKDVASRILQEYPQVVLTPSDPYAFNVWLIRCMPIASIQRVVNTVEEVAAVLRSSAALQEKLEEEFVAVYGHIKGEVERIREAYQTRWEYGADAFQTMLDILEPFIRCMSEVRADPATAERVGKLKPVLTDFNFIIALVVLKNTLCCVSILNPSLKGTISISSTLQFIISNALKLLSKQLQEIAIFHRKWFSDACNRARKLGVEVTLPENLDTSEEGAGRKVQTSPEDFYRATLSTQVLQYLIQEVKQVFSSEMVRILRWLTLVPSYMADHNFSIRRDKVADANLNNLARPDSFYDELGCWEVKWKHASKRRILPTTVFGTLKIPDIGFYPNVQSLLKVLGTIPCVNVEADVYGQYDMVLERFHSYLKVTPPDERLSNVAFVFVNQDVHFSVEDMVDAYVEKHPDILQLLRKEEDLTEPHLKVPEDGEECVSKEEVEESQIMTGDVKGGSPHQSESPEKDQETLKSTLKAVVKMVCGSHIEDALGVCRGSEKGGGLDHMCTPEMKEMLAVCEDAVRAGILAEIGNSFFSLFIDRVVTLGQKDYLPLFLRFVDNFDNMRLELMGFVEADLDADSLSEQLYSTVTEKWHLDLKYCRGQAYLGSGKVAGKLKAFADKIREKYPLAICTHCSCYSFNVWWSKSIPVPAVCRAMDTVEEVILFFSSSPMLEKQLDHVIALGLRESYEKVQELQGIFCAQWLEKHDTYEVLVQMLEPLVDCLEKIRANRQQKWSAAVSEQAGKLLGSIKDFDFIISMVALKNASSFTRELSAGLQKDHFTAATQLCQISGILSTLNRVKTTIKVFHQSWFDEACALALNLAIQIKVPESSGVSRDTMTKPVAYYKEALSAPLVDNLIQAIKDHFSDEHKEALNFLSLVPCSMTVSYMFEILKAKAPLYVSDLPDPGNFFTELCCWRVKWKTRVASVKIPDTIFHTLRLPDMKYFGNVNTLLRIMCVLPSTTMEYCGEARHHKQFQEYLRTAVAEERSSCLAVLQVGCNLTRDLDRMVERCMTVAPKAVEVLCVDKGLKHLVTNTENTEIGMEVEHHEEKVEKPIEAGQDEPLKVLTENGHPGDDRQGLEAIFRTAAQLARRNCQVSDLPSGEQQDLLLDLKNTCHWAPTGEQHSLDISMDEILTLLVRSIRQEVLFEIQKSPFFSLIVDRVATIAGKKYLPTFVKYLFDCSPKVELIGFLPYDDKSDGDALAENFHATLTEDWGLQMKYCRGQAYMRLGAESLGIKKASLNFLGRYPLAINTPCSSSGVVFWLAGCLPCPSVSRGLETVEQLLLFFDQSHEQPEEVAQVAGELLDGPKELVAEEPRTSFLNLVKREDIFDILVDRFEGLLKCLDMVSSNTSGSWSDKVALQASLLSGVMRDADFVVTLVLLKRAFSLSRSFCHVFQCGNSASIVSEMDKAGATIDFLKNALENIDVVHPAWFEEALQLANKVNGGRVSFPQDSCSFESPERYYKQTLSIPILSSLMEEIRHAFSDSHLKTLKYLALVPSCNPGTSVPECLEKMPIIHQIDLPEPDTVQEDLSNWGSFWKEKSGVSLPASVYDTLLHPESECNSNVFTLLKVLAVLPSIRPQSSITEDGLTSLRACLRSAVNRSSKPDLLILQVHQRAVGNLDDVIDKYIEADPERRALLSKVKVNLDHLKKASTLEETDLGCPLEAKELEAALRIMLNQYPEQGQNSSLEPGELLSFYSSSEREEILTDLWDSQFFAVVTEKVTDVEGQPYIPLSVRYLDKTDNQCEETLALIPCYSDPNVLADAIESALSEKWGLNMEYCRGQAYSAIGYAGSQIKSATAILSQKYPLAIRTSSSSVTLNMWLARSSSVLNISRHVATVEKMFAWFRDATELQGMLGDSIALEYPHDEGKQQELKEKLAGEWHRHHDSFQLLVDGVQPLISCLSELIKSPNLHVRRQAQVFYSIVRDFDFVFTIVVLKNITSLTRSLSQNFQGMPADVLSAVRLLPAVKESLNEIQKNIDFYHQTWYSEALALALQLEVKLLHPVLQETLNGYYKNALTAKAVDHCVAEIAELFSDKTLSALKCLTLVPYVMSENGFVGGEEDVASIYRDDLPDAGSLAAELQTWERKWKSAAVECLPATALDTLKVSDIRLFCNVETLLRVLVVLPVTRTESTLRRGKKSLQEFMLQRERHRSQLFPL